MKVDVTQVLKNFQGQPLLTEKKEQMTLRGVLTNALLSVTDKSRRENGEQKYKRYSLSILINTEDEPILGQSDMLVLKNCIPDIYPALVVGVVWDILEFETTPNI